MKDKKELKTDKKQSDKAIMLYKELSCKYYEDGHFESNANMPLSYEEAIRMILELQLYCCDNLKVHPLILQASLHNIFLEHLFAESGNQPELEQQELIN